MATIIGRTVLSLGVALVTVIGVFAEEKGNDGPAQKNDKPLEALAVKVLARGAKVKISKGCANHFSLPSGPEDLEFVEIAVELEEGQAKATYEAKNPKPENHKYTQVKAVQIRRRGNSEKVDLFFVDSYRADKQATKGRGYTYLTSTHGRLEKAALVHSSVEAVKEENEKFAKEVTFWQEWLK